MGKTVAYIATAVLLGVVAMLPVIVLNPASPKGAGPCYAGSILDESLRSKADSERLQSQEYVGIATAPSNPFHVGFILAFSFVVALGVCFYSKRRMF